jgi:hypothetical protein
VKNGTSNRALGRFAVLTAGMTLLLILAGGWVTSTKTGDSISEWPWLMGKIEPGFPIEWTHRALAMVVSLLVTALAIWTHVAEKRAWVRKLAYTALAGILVQAAIGGVRIYLTKAAVGIVHACFGQLVFCAVGSVALVLSRSWEEAGEDAAAGDARGLGTATVIFAFLQLVAGAITRHTGGGLLVHLGGALVVLLLVSLFASRLAGTSLNRAGVALGGLILAQVALGLATWAITSGGFVRSHTAPILPVLTVTSHVADGALVRLTTVLSLLRCHRAAPAHVAAPEGAGA